MGATYLPRGILGCQKEKEVFKVSWGNLVEKTITLGRMNKHFLVILKIDFGKMNKLFLAILKIDWVLKISWRNVVEENDPFCWKFFSREVAWKVISVGSLAEGKHNAEKKCYNFFLSVGNLWRQHCRKNALFQRPFSPLADFKICLSIKLQKKRKENGRGDST